MLHDAARGCRSSIQLRVPATHGAHRRRSLIQAASYVAPRTELVDRELGQRSRSNREINSLRSETKRAEALATDMWRLIPNRSRRGHCGVFGYRVEHKSTRRRCRFCLNLEPKVSSRRRILIIIVGRYPCLTARGAEDHGACSDLNQLED
jgi:hypothetical protein